MEIFELLPYLFFIVIAGMIIGIGSMVFDAVTRSREATKRRKYLDEQPVVSLPVTVVAKRQSTTGGMGETFVATSNYVTFEFIDGNRVELFVPGTVYGMIAERDKGILHSQGSQYNGFDRERPEL